MVDKGGKEAGLILGRGQHGGIRGGDVGGGGAPAAKGKP